eukprot:12926018-Prorocentrum_lima.AAC.1
MHVWETIDEASCDIGPGSKEVEQLVRDDFVSSLMSQEEGCVFGHIHTQNSGQFAKHSCKYGKDKVW